LEVVNGFLASDEGWGETYSCPLCIKLGGEGLVIILHSNGVTAFRVVGDVNVKANDGAGIDGFLIDYPTRLVNDAHHIGIVERVEVDAKLLFVVFAI
jgi:hypothetical protein